MEQGLVREESKFFTITDMEQFAMITLTEMLQLLCVVNLDLLGKKQNRDRSGNFENLKAFVENLELFTTHTQVLMILELKIF